MSKKKFLFIIIGMIFVALAALVYVILSQKENSSCPGPSCPWNKCIKDSSGNEHCPI